MRSIFYIIISISNGIKNGISVVAETRILNNVIILLII